MQHLLGPCLFFKPSHKSMFFQVNLPTSDTICTRYANMDTCGDQRSISRLLSLPPELRDRIYRAVLVEGVINIDSNSKPSTLLQCCSQILEEATEIYYYDNKFQFHIQDNDATVYIRWCAVDACRGACEVSCQITPSTNWLNLVVWLKAVYHHQCCGLSARPSGGEFAGGNVEVLSHIFSMMKHLRDAPFVSWQLAESILQDAHNALTASDPDWA